MLIGFHSVNCHSTGFRSQTQKLAEHFVSRSERFARKFARKKIIKEYLYHKLSVIIPRQVFLDKSVRGDTYLPFGMALVELYHRILNQNKEKALL